MSKRPATIAIAGVITLLTSVSVFLLLVERWGTINFLALIFMIAAEIMLFAGMVFFDTLAQRGSGTFLRAGTYTTLVIYCIASLAISALFMLMLNNKIRLFIASQILLIGIAAIIILIIFTTWSSMSKNSVQNLDLTTRINHMQAAAYALHDNPNNTALVTQLTAVIEELLIINTAGLSTYDKALFEKLDKLEDVLKAEGSDATMLIEVCKDILAIVQLRNQDNTQIKQGGI